MGQVGSCSAHVTLILPDNHPELLTASFAFLPTVQLLTDVTRIDAHRMGLAMSKATLVTSERLSLSECFACIRTSLLTRPMTTVVIPPTR